jgi:WW domain
LMHRNTMTRTSPQASPARSEHSEYHSLSRPAPRPIALGQFLQSVGCHVLGCTSPGSGNEEIASPVVFDLAGDGHQAVGGTLRLQNDRSSGCCETSSRTPVGSAKSKSLQTAIKIGSRIGQSFINSHSTAKDDFYHSTRPRVIKGEGQGSKRRHCSSKMPSDASHWKSAVDPRTGRTYYYHELTRETQWRKPMDLASNDEKKAMEDKERKQKDFFSAMEANILASMSQGVVPGTPKQPVRQKSKQPPPANNGGPRPELMRTISTMDESALKDIIMRQPSFRNVQKKHSLQISDLERSNHGSDGDFSSLTNMPLDPLAESAREFENFDQGSVDNMFDDLPYDGNESDEDSIEEGGKSTKSHGSLRADGGKLNASSISGFGLTWEETRALKKLAEISKEMIAAENDDNMQFGSLKAANNKGAPGTPFLHKGDAKGQRELPRELDFDDESESTRGDGETPVLAAAAKRNSGPRALPRELDFDDDSDSESAESPAVARITARTSVVRIADGAKKKDGSSKKEAPVRPLTRRNTCGTLYVGTTMSAPDKDATIQVRLEGT